MNLKVSPFDILSHDKIIYFKPQSTVFAYFNEFMGIIMEEPTEMLMNIYLLLMISLLSMLKNVECVFSPFNNITGYVFARLY